MIKSIYTYKHWTSKLAILSVFIILNNLMGCERICPLRPSSVTITSEELGSTSASFMALITTGDDPSLSKSEVGCDENCEIVACTLSSFVYRLVDAQGNSIVVDPNIYDNIFKEHVVRENSPKTEIERSITLNGLNPGTVYNLTVAFPIAHSCLSLGPKERVLTFTTLPETCITLDCGENGAFNQETCGCDCNEGHSGDNCETQNTVLPTNLDYQPDSVAVSINQEAISPEPTVDGTPPFNFELVRVNPTNGSVTSSIDANTGVIRLTSTAVNDVQGYQAEVKVSNAAGDATFQRAFVVTVIDQVSTGAPTDLIYDPDTVNYNGTGQFDSVQPTVNGSLPVTFAKAAVSPQNAAGAIVVNPTTGVITASDLREFGTGTYQVDVTVSNDQGSTTFVQVYTLIVDP